MFLGQDFPLFIPFRVRSGTGKKGTVHGDIPAGQLTCCRAFADVLLPCGEDADDFFADVGVNCGFLFPHVLAQAILYHLRRIDELDFAPWLSGGLSYWTGPR